MAGMEGITREQALQLASEVERPILEIIFSNIGTIRTNRSALNAAREIAHSSDSRVERLEAQIKGLMNCMANDQQEIEELKRQVKFCSEEHGWAK